MNYPLEFHPEARTEADEARDWYVEQAPHMEQRLLDEFDAAIEWISSMPMACPRGVLGTRFTILRSFPYVIHFRLHDERVQVLAVAHSRREPTYWHHRLS